MNENPTLATKHQLNLNEPSDESYVSVYRQEVMHTQTPA